MEPFLEQWLKSTRWVYIMIDCRSALPLMFVPYAIAQRMPFFKKSVAGMKVKILLFVLYLLRKAIFGADGAFLQT